MVFRQLNKLIFKIIPSNASRDLRMLYESDSIFANCKSKGLISRENFKELQCFNEKKFLPNFEEECGQNIVEKVQIENQRIAYL